MTGYKLPIQDIMQNVYDEANESVKTTANEAASATAPSKQVTVATAGTAVALALGTTKKFTVRADDSNTGNVAVGDSGVTMLNGYVLTPGESTNVITANDATALMYVNAATSGDKVSVIYEN